MTASGLVEFLLSRLGEERALAVSTAERMEHVPPASIGGVGNLGIVGYPVARVLADVEAKRRMVREAEDQVSEYFSRFVLETLASVYADHPDFDPAWLT